MPLAAARRGKARGRPAEDAMRNKSKEYSLAELLDHPVVGFAMQTDGIDRRCLQLLLEAASRERYREQVWFEEPFVD